MNNIAPVGAYVFVSVGTCILVVYLQYKLGTYTCTCTWDLGEWV